jgi:uncharacterized protein (DUF3084 family)
MQDRRLPVRTGAVSASKMEAPHPRGFWTKVGFVLGGLVSAATLCSVIAGAGIWGYNKLVDHGRGLEKADQVVRDLAELQSTKEQLKTAHIRNQQIQSELERLLKDRETLRSERDSLRSQLDARQADVLQLTKMLAANDNCSFVHRQIEAAQKAVDTHYALGGPTQDYLRRHQILLDRLKEYQNQLGQCSGRATAAR